jgi:4-aminobutyrate aminotransferase
VKLARHETGRQNVIVFRGGFHGRSLGALAMTSSKTAYGVGYGPLPSGFHHTPFPTCVHCTCAGKAGAHSPGAAEAAGKTFTCCGFATESLQQLLKEVSDPKDTAAIMLEPILGEGGYIAPPPGFMRELRALCDKHGMLLIADEVQSGVGRTGKFWAMEHEGVVPDITVFAKGIASGIPLSGIATRGDMMRKSPPGSMGGTYGANAVAAAAAVATIDAIVEEGMLANAAARGAQLQAALRRLAAKHPEHTLDVRGRGCMVGWEFNMPAGSGFAGHVTACAMEEGALLLTSVRRCGRCSCRLWPLHALLSPQCTLLAASLLRRGGLFVAFLFGLVLDAALLPTQLSRAAVCLTRCMPSRIRSAPSLPSTLSRHARLPHSPSRGHPCRAGARRSDSSRRW